MADKIINIDEGDVNADWIKLANPAAQKQELAIHARLAKQFKQEAAKGKPKTKDTDMKQDKTQATDTDTTPDTDRLSPDNPDVA
jgi:hypothetical protein